MTVAPDDSLSTAITLMERLRAHHLLVIEAGRMAGIPALLTSSTLPFCGSPKRDDTSVGIVTTSDLIALLVDQVERDTPSRNIDATLPEEPRGAVTAARGRARTGIRRC
jgi:CBS domain-containing protein